MNKFYIAAGFIAWTILLIVILSHYSLHFPIGCSLRPILKPLTVRSVIAYIEPPSTESATLGTRIPEEDINLIDKIYAAENGSTQREKIAEFVQSYKNKGYTDAEVSCLFKNKVRTNSCAYYQTLLSL